MTNKDFYLWLNHNGYLNYGSIIPKETIYKMLDIEVPERGTMQEFEAIKLKELAYMDYVRMQLLEIGRYIESKGDKYYIPLPSQNNDLAQRYLKKANNKIKRAMTLMKNTPHEHVLETTFDASAAIKLDYIKKNQDHLKSLQ